MILFAKCCIFNPNFLTKNIMNTEVNSHASIEAANIRVLKGLEALTIKTRDKITPDTRFFVTDDGKEIFVKNVQGGLNVFMPKTPLPIHFVKDDEIADNRKSGILSMLDNCTEMKIDESETD